MASLTAYLSIWVGIILVGFLIFNEQWLDSMNVFAGIIQDPSGSILEYLSSAFDVKGIAFYIGSIMFLGVVAATVTNVFSGGGMSLLFVIPALLIFTIITLMFIPLNAYVVAISNMPFELKMIYSLFMGLLTFLTFVSFTGGRS